VKYVRENAKVGCAVVVQELDGSRTSVQVTKLTIRSIFTEDGRTWRRKSGLLYGGAWEAIFVPYLLGSEEMIRND
jgi:hypothetical protein